MPITKKTYVNAYSNLQLIQKKILATKVQLKGNPEGRSYLVYFPERAGLRSTKITESPRKNILATYLSLFTGFDFDFPLPDLGVSVHISLTFSSTMLKCRSKAFTLANSFRLFRQLIRTCVLCFTDWLRTERGPV